MTETYLNEEVTERFINRLKLIRHEKSNEAEWNKFKVNLIREFTREKPKFSFFIWLEVALARAEKEKLQSHEIPIPEEKPKKKKKKIDPSSNWRTAAKLGRF